MPRLLTLLRLASVIYAVASVSQSAMAAGTPSLPFVTPMFSSNMVLQRDQKDPIWGWTTPGATVTVTVDGKSVDAVADSTGKWMAMMPSKPAGGPYDVAVAGPKTVHFTNVLYGDVWICSGQSNMAMALSSAANGAKEVAEADHPQIRLFIMGLGVEEKPLQVPLSGSWSVCSPQTVVQGFPTGFSAVGYFFGRQLQHDLNIPIGLIESDWGGTPVEAWTDYDSLKPLPDFADLDTQIHKHTTDREYADKKTMDDTDEWMADNDAPSRANPTPADPAYVDTSWKTMTLPGAWDKSELPGYHGVVWFRRTLDLSDADIAADAVLHLGHVRDRNTTWVNGIQVGRSYKSDNIEYPVPASALHVGANVVTVRVLDTAPLAWPSKTEAMRDGGLDGPPGQMYLESSGGVKQPITGDWKYLASTSLGNGLPDPPKDAFLGPFLFPNYPTTLYNAMIAPIFPLAFTGATWYQGEANANRPEQYHELLPAMITGWRKNSDNKDFPFLIVQLPNFDAAPKDPSDDTWARLREAQAATYKDVPNTGLAVTIDIGDPEVLHPTDKQDVGKRLALIAEAKTYHKHIEYSGPEFVSKSVDGNRLIVKFSHAGGLAAKGGSLTGFFIAGADGNYTPADATIKGDSVILTAAGVPAPVDVRYDFANSPSGNLYNKAGLPAAPFRTDTIARVMHQAESDAEVKPAAPAVNPADTTVIDGKTVNLTVLPDGLKYYDMKIGAGDTPKIGQTISVQYTGTLLDGTKFDSSYDHGGTPIDFPIGVGRVIKGWDEGVPTMRVGGKRRLVIPGDLAYGANSPTPAIPANATLVFDIELVGIK